MGARALEVKASQPQSGACTDISALMVLNELDCAMRDFMTRINAPMAADWIAHGHAAIRPICVCTDAGLGYVMHTCKQNQYRNCLHLHRLLSLGQQSLCCMKTPRTCCWRRANQGRIQPHNPRRGAHQHLQEAYAPLTHAATVPRPIAFWLCSRLHLAFCLLSALMSAGWLDHVKAPTEDLVAEVCKLTKAAFRAMILSRLPDCLTAVGALLLDEVAS